MDLDFGLPRQPVLKKAPLKLVVAQLRFPKVLAFSDDLVRPIQLALAGGFPDVQTEDLQQVRFGPEGITATGEHQRLYRFRTHTEDWVATVAETALSLETTAYIDFHDFIGRWQQVAGAVIDALELKHQERLGIRYVDELEAPEAASRQQLEELVRPELLGIAGAHARTERLLKAWQETRFMQDDGVCTLQHGYGMKPDTTWVYTLDFDYYEEGGRDIELATQMQSLAHFNHGIYELFRWAVTEEQFASFGPEEKSSDGA